VNACKIAMILLETVRPGTRGLAVDQSSPRGIDGGLTDEGRHGHASGFGRRRNSAHLSLAARNGHDHGQRLRRLEIDSTPCGLSVKME
jgi:hypothetical protein